MDKIKKYTQNEWRTYVRKVNSQSEANFDTLYAFMTSRSRCNQNIFSTRFECIFGIFSTRFECIFGIFSTRFECSFSFFVVIDAEKRSKNYTQNEWRRSKTTLETSGEDPKLHSKRVEKIQNYTRNERNFPPFSNFKNE